MGCIPCLQVNLAHAGVEGLSPKLPALTRRLAEAHVAAGQLEDAELALRALLGPLSTAAAQQKQRLSESGTAASVAEAAATAAAAVGGDAAAAATAAAAAGASTAARPMLSREERLPLLCLLADIELREDASELEARVAARIERRRAEVAAAAARATQQAAAGGWVLGSGAGAVAAAWLPSVACFHTRQCHARIGAGNGLPRAPPHIKHVRCLRCQQRSVRTLRHEPPPPPL